MITGERPDEVIEKTSLYPTQTFSAEVDSQVQFLRNANKPRRILYVPGPGDVRGSFLHWSDGRNDPSIISIAYSQQVYELLGRIGAELVTLTEDGVSTEDSRPRLGIII